MLKLKKKKIYHHKNPTFGGDVDTEKVLVSNKISFGDKHYKYFIGYMYNGNKVKPLNIMLPKRSAYVMMKVMINKLNGCIFGLNIKITTIFIKTI